MIKTVNLTANEELKVKVTGGCHVLIENRGTDIIYVSANSGIVAGADGVKSVDPKNSKILLNVADYIGNGTNYNYIGEIYLMSSADGVAEIETSNDVKNFFRSKNLNAGGGETSGVVDAYSKTETDLKLSKKLDATTYEYDKTEIDTAITNLQNEKIDKIENYSLVSDAEIDRLSKLENYDDTQITQKIENAETRNNLDTARLKSEIGTVKKNLITHGYTVVSDLNGITFTLDSEKRITCNGTATAWTSKVFSTYTKLLAGEKYIGSGSPDGSGESTYNLQFNATQNGNPVAFKDYGEGVEITTDEDVKLDFYITIQKGQSLNNVVFEPMVRYADITDDTYEAFREGLQAQINKLQSRIEALEAANG